MKDMLKSPEFQEVKKQFKGMDFKNKRVYGDWLAQTYYFVCHSVRLSALGVSKLPVETEISKRMLAHALEEKGHNVLAEKDLEELGFKPSDFREYGLTKAFYQSQYYKVLFEHPCHLMGQIYMLEAFAVDVGPWMYDQVKSAYGNLATRFVKVHAHEDIDHVQKAVKAISAMPPEIIKGVEENFYQACDVYLHILKKINLNQTMNLKSNIELAG